MRNGAKKMLTFFLNQPLKRKLMMMLMLIAATAVIITCTAFAVYDIHNRKQSMVENLSLISHIIGARTAPGMQFVSETSKAKALQNLLDLRNTPAVVLACLYSVDGSVFASYSSQGTTEECGPTVAIGDHFSEGHLTIHQQISSINGKVVGSIFLKADMREIDEYLNELSIGITVLILTVLSLSYVIASLIQRSISNPILYLATTAQEISQSKDYAIRAQPFYEDEVGQLVGEFNTMLAEIQQQDEQLKSFNDELEGRILARTRDLESQKIKAEKANEAKSEFLRNMSHEFRTPLHAMSSFCRFGIEEADTADSDTLQSYFERIQRSAERLSKLIENILCLARADEGGTLLHMKQHNLARTVKKVVEDQEGLLLDKHLNVEVTGADSSLLMVYDEDKITQVVTNILGNAIKFSPEHGNITIMIEAKTLNGESGREANVPAFAVSVIDEGIGIPEGELEDIFEKFIQSSRTKTGAGGTGLGLPICKELVTSHNGAIWAESMEKGSKFTFVIPCDLLEGTFKVGRV